MIGSTQHLRHILPKKDAVSSDQQPACSHSASLQCLEKVGKVRKKTELSNAIITVPTVEKRISEKSIRNRVAAKNYRDGQKQLIKDLKIGFKELEEVILQKNNEIASIKTKESERITQLSESQKISEIEERYGISIISYSVKHRVTENKFDSI